MTRINAAAWLWLSACYDDAGKRKECLQSVLRVDPTNGAARRGLKHLEFIEIDQSQSAPVSATPVKTEAKRVDLGVAPVEKTNTQRSSQTEDLAWVCPDCRSRNITPVVLRTRTTIRCRRCAQEYECVNGEAIWGQCDIDRAVWSQWLDWIVRLQQADGSVVEVGFTLHTRDFTIAGGDFLVVLMEQGWGGRSKVVQIDNKTTGNHIRPGKL